MVQRRFATGIAVDLEQLPLARHRQARHYIGTDFVANLPHRAEQNQVAAGFNRCGVLQRRLRELHRGLRKSVRLDSTGRRKQNYGRQTSQKATAGSVKHQKETFLWHH